MGEQRYSLVALKLHTGRTHQIRVHMLSIGHPLVCDTKYAEELFPMDRQWCPRNFLHTYRLAFQDVPLDGTTKGGSLVEAMCPLPGDLREALGRLSPVDDTSAALHADWLAGDSHRLKP